MTHGSPQRSRLRWIDAIMAAGVIAAVVAMFLGELGRLNWLLELCSHFLVQYAIALAIAAVYFLLRRRWRWLAIAILVIAFSAWRLLPYTPAAAAAATATAGDHHLRIMTINVHASSERYDLVRSEIERLDPDVVFLPENTDRWAAGLAPLRARYPYVVDGQSSSVFSLFLFSRVPLSDPAIVNLPEPDGFPAIVTRVCPAGAEPTCLLVVGVHPPPPISERIAAKRYAALQALPSLIAGRGADRIVLLGDFNCTPWSPLFRDLLAATGLRDSARGFDLLPTWASRWLPFGLKIDHILVSKTIGVADHQVGDDVGSDHFPVVVDIAY